MLGHVSNIRRLLHVRPCLQQILWDAAAGFVLRSDALPVAEPTISKR